MYVIKAANGNIYPVEQCVYRIGPATGGGYKLTHLSLITVTESAGAEPNPGLADNPAAATAGAAEAATGPAEAATRSCRRAR